MILIARALTGLALRPGSLYACCMAVLASILWAWAGATMSAPIINTATVNFTGPAGFTTLASNTTTVNSIAPATPAQVIFYQAAPGSGSNIDFGTGPVEVRPTDVFHINESVYITLADANRNLDPLVRETFNVTIVSNTVPGDTETVLMRETSPNSGVFAAVIPSTGPTFAVNPNNGQISVATDTRIRLSYQDPFYPLDNVVRDALVDPLGTVFDSVTGAPINGVSVTLIDNATGLPATVFGDDGVSSFPSTVITGSTVTDGGGQIYNLPPGGFRFPFIAPGNYRFQLGPIPGYTVPSAVPNSSLANDGAGNPYAAVTGSRGETFVVVIGPVLNIDIPADPASSLFFLLKDVSRTEASAGDFLQYRLELRNNAAIPASAATFNDVLPPGMRFQAGSLRVNEQAAADPAQSEDGRTLTFNIGNVAAGAVARVSYVVQLGAGVQPGEAVNTARARANAGTLISNAARVAVRIREPLFSGRFTIIGRVFEGECATPWRELKGVANARVMLEDGTYVVTDKDGQYHFEAVRPGTHVVQLDLDSLPAGQEPLSCIENTRFAGRSFSQFVDVKGGGLWRADFFTRKQRAQVGIRMQSWTEAAQAQRDQRAAVNRAFTHRVEVDGSTPVDKLQVMTMLPEVAVYEPGSTRVDGRPAADPAIADSLATFSLGAEPRSAWSRVIEFRTTESPGPLAPQAPQPAVIVPVPAPPVASPALPAAAPAPRPLEPGELVITSRQIFNAQFDRCSDKLPPVDRAALEKLLTRLRSEGGIVRIELIGYADSRDLSAECRAKFRSNDALSEARAKALGEFAAPRLDLSAQQVRIVGRGTQALVDDRRDVDAMIKNRSADMIVYARAEGGTATPAISASVEPAVVNPAATAPAAATATLAPAAAGQAAQESTTPASGRVAPAPVQSADTAAADCSPIAVKAMASFESAGTRARTPVVASRLACATLADGDRPPGAETGARQAVDITPSAADTLPPEIQQRRAATDVAASGAERDWFAGQQPGVDWLFPDAAHNPRAPALRIVIKHAAGQSVLLKSPDGEAVNALNFDGTQLSADQKMAVSIWRGVPLAEGDNIFTAEIFDAAGQQVQKLSRAIRYANTPARAVLVPEQSILLADGRSSPVIAVRILDRDGRPVRAGVMGPLRIQTPYRSQQEVEFELTRQLAGLDRFEPQYRVEGDDGIAYIELAPTTESGNVQLDLGFPVSGNGVRRQELRAWLEPRTRDWVVVGFAEGTAGYNTLKDNSHALEGRIEDGSYTDGQISLYAKGRVLGKWLLTMAFDSDKANDRRQSLLGTIDPNEYYTLYGDGTQQRYDAPSQDKLYLKIERAQFYALFGDYDTGLTQTQLSRYSRTLNGVKSENGGGPVVFTVFAAQTPQHFARDEIQGDGTSGLYRLSQRGIVLNSEKIHIETRDRLHSERILETRSFARHLDYDIDYSNGTLFFRQPVYSRDVSFNPVFIIAEYETLDVADEELNAGGRVGLNLMDGKVQVGVTGIRDESNLGADNLGGADLKLRVGKDSEIRVEAAQTDGQAATLEREGTAWLAEFEHHSGRYDALVYARRQESGFGLRQQNASAAGQQKIGAQGQVRLDETWSVQSEVYQQENLDSQTTRDAVLGKLRYQTEKGGFSVGAQSVTDSTDLGALAGRDYRSDQGTLSVNRWLMDRKLEVSAQSETTLGGSSDSADFPDRYLLGASYSLADYARLLAGQEFTDGAYDTSTTRVGLQVLPWKGARLDSTLNQAQISENGSRTFSQMGLTQAVLINDRWGLDFGLDSSQTLDQSTQTAPVLNPAHPGTGAPGIAGKSEDFMAVSTGATYRTNTWSWNGRAETRNGETTDRYGLVSHFLRQAQAGVAFASSAQVFRSEQSSGTKSWLAGVDLSWAWRPLGLNWSILDRLELRYEDVENGSGATGAGLFGSNSLSARNASTRRLINNFALNFVSREWRESDRQGNLFKRYERSQFSVYYGAKYAFDTLDGVSYSGYTDLIGLEARHDINSWFDIGVQASSLNSWSTRSHAYSFGPSIGFSPVTNGWITVGYNHRGFTDRDFDAARYTAQGIYLQLRFKFDQNTQWSHRSATATGGIDSSETGKP